MMAGSWAELMVDIKKMRVLAFRFGTILMKRVATMYCASNQRLSLVLAGRTFQGDLCYALLWILLNGQFWINCFRKKTIMSPA